MSARRRTWVVLGAMSGAVSMVVIDQTMVSLAVPSLQRSLNMTEAQMLWVVNAYVLAMASLVAIGGRLGDLFGRTTLFRIGACVFVGGSALSGAATSTAWIIGARVVQGAGVAAMLPASSAIIVGSVRPQERGRILGISTGISMSVLAVGPFVGGLLTQVLGWRAVFFVNVPIGLAVVAATFVAVPAPRTDPSSRIDWMGVGLLAPGLVAVILGLMQAASWGWGSPPLIAMVGAGVLLLVAFVLVELSREDPLVDLRRFRNRNFAGDSVVRTLMQFAVAGTLVLSAVWVQDALGFRPVVAGPSMLPLTAPLVFVAPVAGHLYDRWGPRLLAAAGALAFGIALLWMAAVLGRQSYSWVVPAYLTIGVGVGFMLVPVTTDALNAAPTTRHGQASGLFATVSEIGGTLGLAVLGTVVAVVQQAHIDAFLRAAGVRAAAVGGIERFLAESAKGGRVPVPDGLPPDTFKESAAALTSATADAFYVAGGVMLVAPTVAWLALRRIRAPGDAV